MEGDADGGPAAPASAAGSEFKQQSWNWHVQNTVIVQGDPGFYSKYSGPNSLDSRGEVRESVSLDLMAGVRLWRGAEAHIDGLMWQGKGLSDTVGVEGFPNGEAFRLGTDIPNVNIARLFIRQTIGFGGEQENVEDDQLHLAGRQDISRLTITVGKMSALDIFDDNAYAHDPRTQFMNWALVANEAWDYPADAIGYITGLAAELNQREWTLRYGFYQVPKVSNGVALDQRFLEAWAMVTEFERRYVIGERKGVVRLLAFLNRAHMGNYRQAVESPIRPADIVATEAYRYKYGFGLNIEQELTKYLGVFTRLGWSDGQNEAWMFSDVDMTATLGISLKGARWSRPNDTFGLAGILDGLSQEHHEFFAAQGLGILAGDYGMTYRVEQDLEAYYDFQIWRTIHGTLDYQFINHPANNRDRGPVSVFAARLHWEF